MENLLSRWLAEAGISQNELERRIGAKGGTVTRWVSGERIPGARYMKAISDASNGAVPMTFWAEVQSQRSPSRRRRKRAKSPRVTQTRGASPLVE